jgi:hypothetical protein
MPPFFGVINMKWTKPSGIEIETNEDQVTIDYCESLGWEAEDDEAEAEAIAEAKAAKDSEDQDDKDLI